MRSKSLVKDLVYEEPFGYRVVHHDINIATNRCKQG